eukprot:2449354-Amphidinium_carterae.1
MAPKKRKLRPGFLARVPSPWAEVAVHDSDVVSEPKQSSTAALEGHTPRSSLRPKRTPGPSPTCFGTPAASARIPRTPTTAERRNAPVLAPRARGSLSTALSVARNLEELREAAADYQMDVLASSSRAAAD